MLLVVAFVRYELRQDDPILEPRFLPVGRSRRRRPRSGCNLALYGTLLAVPVLLADRPGWSEEIGLAVGALSFPLLAFSPVGGRLSDRAGRRTAAVTGLALVTAGLMPLALAGTDVGSGLLIGSIAIAGAGLGLSNAAVQAAGVEAAPRHAGIASGIFSTGRYLGGIASASLVAGLVSGGGGDYGMLFTIETAAALTSTFSPSHCPAASGAGGRRGRGLPRVAAHAAPRGSPHAAGLRSKTRTPRANRSASSSSNQERTTGSWTRASSGKGRFGRAGGGTRNRAGARG